MPQIPPIEDKSDLRSFLRDTTEWSFTILMWGLWVYLFLPLVSLLLWVIGLPHIYRTVFREDVLQQLLRLLGGVGWMVLVIFIVLRGWGFYNYYVFGKRNRRREYPEVSLEDLSKHFDLSPEEVQVLQDQKEITWTVLYDEIGAKEEPHEH